MTTTTRRAFLAASALLAPPLAIAASAPAAAQVGPEGGVRRVDGLVVYLGVVPAALARDHPPGGSAPPTARHAYHLVVAAFEAGSGARVADATVTATVHGLGHVGRPPIALEPMTIANAASYGGFVVLPATDTYRILVEIRRPGAADGPARAEFTYRHVAS